MELKGIKLIEYTVEGLFVYTKFSVEDGQVFGKPHPIPVELTGITTFGVYNVDEAPVDLGTYVEPASWLPVIIHREFSFAAMDGNGKWYVYIGEPHCLEGRDYWDNCSPREPSSLNDLIYTQRDPLGSKSSLHTRDAVGNWVRV